LCASSTIVDEKAYPQTTLLLQLNGTVRAVEQTRPVFLHRSMSALPVSPSAYRRWCHTALGPLNVANLFLQAKITTLIQR